MNCLIEAEALTKTYACGDSLIRALDGVSLRIEAGEMVAVTGESGSGKSTLLHVLGCLDRPDAGRYRLAGRDVASLSGDERAAVRNRRIGFVFQSFNLLPRLNALENVEMPLLYAGRTRAREQAAEALRAVGLADRAHHRPSQLSGGQRQRVAIARALVSGPDLILADEPTGNLDSHTGEEILALFQQIHGEGRTLVIVSHNPEVAQRCGRRIHMVDGRIVDGASP
jgi:putative ABC transport system ATP-binding protein